MTHDDVFARLAAADPLPDEALITADDLTLLASLVDEARSTGGGSGVRRAAATRPLDTAVPIRQRWTLRPAFVAATAAAVMIVIVGIGAVLMVGRGTAPAGDPPVTTIIDPLESTSTSTVTTTTTMTGGTIEEIVADLEWTVVPFTEALESDVLGFNRAEYFRDLFLYQRLQRPEYWPHDRFDKPDHDCPGGWSGEQVLESPSRIVAICDEGDWTPQRVRTWVWEDDTWVEVPTDPTLWSGWINGDDNRDGSLGPAGIFGAATDIGVGFMANGTADYLWASEDGITWVQVPDTADVFPERSITRAIGTFNGLVFIVGELDWPADRVDGSFEDVVDDALVVWIAELPPIGGES